LQEHCVLCILNTQSKCARCTACLLQSCQQSACSGIKCLKTCSRHRRLLAGAAAAGGGRCGAHQVSSCMVLAIHLKHITLQRVLQLHACTGLHACAHMSMLPSVVAEGFQLCLHGENKCASCAALLCVLCCAASRHVSTASCCMIFTIWCAAIFYTDV
jgi:hypothetical protein